MSVDTLERPQARQLAEARAAVYRFLQTALDQPTAEQLAWLHDATFRRALDLLCERFEVERPDDPLAPAGLADHQARYLACFEVGFPHAPVPLRASHYKR